MEKINYEEQKELYIKSLQAMISRIAESKSERELSMTMSFFHNPIDITEPNAEHRRLIEGRREWMFFFREMHQERDLIEKYKNANPSLD